MNPQHCKAYLLKKPECNEDYPFGPDAAVFKVYGKMFALLAERHGKVFINLKCDPQQALMLRDVFPAIEPGYHMNKKHWNTIYIEADIPNSEIERLIDHSYTLVVCSLKKAERQRLELIYGKDELYR